MFAANYISTFPELSWYLLVALLFFNWNIDAAVRGMSYLGRGKKARPIITREFCWICRQGGSERVYPLGENLIKSNFHLFKKKRARARGKNISPRRL